MKKPLFFLGSAFLLANSAVGQAASSAVAQPTACINSQFSSSGDQYWKNITLTLTNKCTSSVDFENTTVSFKNKKALNTSFWGDFAPLPYPVNGLNIVSQQQSDGTFLSSFNLNFKAYPGTSTLLPVGKSIKINYGAPSDDHIDGGTNVYVGPVVSSTGSIILKNTTAKPSDINQNYALVHITMNGQKINDVQLPWNSSVTINNLAVGSYNLAADQVSSVAGASYQASVNPSTVNVAEKQQINANISYNLVQQEGKIALNLQNLPAEIVNYTAKPSVAITHTQSGSSVSQVLNWNSNVTVGQLKLGENYKLSTPVISSNGYNCTASFDPAQLTAGTTAPISKLTYKCTQVAQNSVSLNVSGAPATLSSLKVNLTPNNGQSQNVNISLNNGAGMSTVTLPDGIIYTLSTDSISGYTVKFSPQPLISAQGTSANISFSQQSTGTPTAENGQLTVCGTKLCNANGVPIQLKGMSTHGLQWFPQCFNNTSFGVLRNQFKSNMVRLALYVQEGGYSTDPAKYTQQMNNLIEMASNQGMYVIIDWHILSPGDPNLNLDLAKKFFSDIISANKNRTNLIYEIANEPNGVSWEAIKTYANQIIPVIRALDPKAPIIVGTRAWSSLGLSDGSSAQEIVNNPINFPNIMYAFHFYAASHQDYYLNGLDKASDLLPIFVTEFGTQTYSGDGGNDFNMTDRYMQLMATKKIGWANWNFSDDHQSSAIWTSNTCQQNVWSDDHLKPSGVYIKNKISNP